jgi:PAS domain S-box-containing protein
MEDKRRTKEQLTNELIALRQRVAELERSENDRKLAKEALHEREEMFRLFMEHSPIYVFFKDEKIRSIELSKNYEKMLGRPVHELIGKTMCDLFPSELANSMVKDDLRILREGKPIEVVEELNGRVYTTTKFPIIREGKPSRLAGFTMDITDRKQMETALRESEQRFRSLVETTSDWVWETDRHGFYTYASPKVKELLGYDSREVIGKKPFDFMPLEEAGRTAKLFRNIGKSRKPFTRLENAIVHKDGHVVVLETSGVPIFEKDGNFAGYRGIDRDITERKRAEEDRKSLEARIQRMEKMEALGTLAGGVAHDLNNILSGIVGYPDLILMQLPDNSPLRESILAIRRSGQRAAEVVQDLVTLARRGMFSTEVMNWNRVISDYMKSPEQEKIQSLRPNVRFEVLLETDLLPIKGSRVHLFNTLMNLLSNAAEAMPERGVVTIMTTNQYLDRPVKGYDNVKEGDYVVIKVSDTGRGISAEDIDRIFEPFYTRKITGKSGTGLGLAVVWGTVKDHNGYIDVQSEEGRGTTFTLYFPVSREALTLDPSPISLLDYMGKGETILVVDDVWEQRELVVAMLNKLNYRVTSVSSGEAAIETAKIQQPDLLILDMIMDPGMDGLETYKRFLELHPGQKAIIVSGFSETERVKQALDLGAGAFLKKPYILEKIGVLVRQELDKCSLSTR